MLVVTLNKGLFCLSAVIFEFSVCGVCDGYLKMSSRIVLPVSLKKKKVEKAESVTKVRPRTSMLVN